MSRYQLPIELSCIYYCATDQLVIEIHVAMFIEINHCLIMV